jgi:N-formylmaleamate deformylase
VILEDPPWRVEVEQGRAAMLEEWRANIVEQKRMSREALIARCREEHPTWDETILGSWAESKRQLSLNVFGGFGGQRTPWQETAAQISCPTLLITADPDLGAIVTPEVAEEAVEMNTHIKAVHIDGAGHSIRREAFEPFMQAVTEFLAAA